MNIRFFLVSLFSLETVIFVPRTLALSNGSFESGFSGWMTGGNVSIQTSAFGVNPTQGLNQALATTYDLNPPGTLPLEVGVVGGLEDFLGLPLTNPSIFDDPSNPTTGIAREGSVLKQTLNVQAGDVLTLDWNFLSNDTLDYGFILLEDVNNLNSVTFNDLFRLNNPTLPLPAGNPFAQQTGYQPFSYTFATGGTYLLAVGGVVDLNDFDGNSGTLVDNIVLTPNSSNPIPESQGVFSLIFLGFTLGRMRSSIEAR
jgi:hypothetical protein